MVKPAQSRKLALQLPETSEAPHFHYASFRVRGKIFATLSPEGDLFNVFVDEEDRQRALVLDPVAFTRLEWGGRVVGVQVNLAVAKPAMVKGLLLSAWSRKAPKKLLNAMSPGKT